MCIQQPYAQLEEVSFMVYEEITLGHKISKKLIEVDRAKVGMIARLAPPYPIKAVRSFLGHVEFYKIFIKDFSKFLKPLTTLLQREKEFEFYEKKCYLFNWKNLVC